MTFVRKAVDPVVAKVDDLWLRNPPIIVVGMHRSGTSLVTRLLERSGVFMGRPQSYNAEAVFFQHVNRQILESFGASWRSLESLPSPERLAGHGTPLDRRLRGQLRRGLLPRFWGLSAPRLRARARPAWGWKDPRTSVLLPIWARQFPNAAVVHVVRDGRDVVESLAARDVKRFGSELFDPAEERVRMDRDLDLWEAYVRRIESTRALFPSWCSVRYETLLAAPRVELDALVEGLHLRPRHPLDAILEIVGSPTERASEPRHRTWRAAAASRSPLLAELGYVVED